MSATDPYTIMRENEGAQPVAKGHTEKMSLRKINPKPQLLAAGAQVHSLLSSEAELQEGRYWLLLPQGNTRDRLKRRGKKNHFAASVPWTRKGSWHQQTNQRWKLMRSKFPFSSIIPLIFSDWLGLERCPGKSINIEAFLAFLWNTPKTIWIPVGRS